MCVCVRKYVRAISLVPRRSLVRGEPGNERASGDETSVQYCTLPKLYKPIVEHGIRQKIELHRYGSSVANFQKSQI